MERAKVFVINGLTALLLSLIIWKLTHNFWGWLVLFLPGSALILYGWWVALREKD